MTPFAAEFETADMVATFEVIASTSAYGVSGFQSSQEIARSLSRVSPGLTSLWPDLRAGDEGWFRMGVNFVHGDPKPSTDALRVGRGSIPSSPGVSSAVGQGVGGNLTGSEMRAIVVLGRAVVSMRRACTPQVKRAAVW